MDQERKVIGSDWHVRCLSGVMLLTNSDYLVCVAFYKVFVTWFDMRTFV